MGVQVPPRPPPLTCELRLRDYFGRTVKAAARIAEYAGPGQVLVSDNVVRSTQNRAIRFDDIGPVELKGMPRPIPLHLAVPAT